MINSKFLTVLLLAIILQSCFKDDGDPLPASGENSFTVELDGKQFVAEDVRKFARTYLGITADVDDSDWLLIFSNSSDRRIYIYLHEIEEVGNYDVGANDKYNLFIDNSSESTISSISIVDHKSNNLPSL